MTQTQKTTYIVALALFLAGFAFMLYITSQKAFGSAPSGLPAAYATTTTMGVGPNWAQIFLNSVAPNCSSRVISTSLNPIRLVFGTMASSSATSTFAIGTNIGLLQPASTTVAYDSGVFGCGFVGVQGMDVTTSTVTMTTYN